LAGFTHALLMGHFGKLLVVFIYMGFTFDYLIDSAYPEHWHFGLGALRILHLILASS